MGTDEHHDLSACVDCLMWIANGEVDPGWSEVQAAAFVARVASHWAGYRLVVACGDDCEGSFSMSACEVCGSGLGGDRHPVTAIPVD